MNYFKQIFMLLKINTKIKYKNILLFGVLPYVVILSFGLLNPALLKTITKQSFSNKKFVLSVIVFCTSFAFPINIFFGTYRIIGNFIGRKRTYLLMPFDYIAKLHSVYIFAIMWVFLNLISFLLIIFVTVLGFEEVNVTDFFRSFSKFYESLIEDPVNTIVGIFTILFFILTYLSVFIFSKLVKSEDKKAINVIKFLAIIIVFSNISNGIIKFFEAKNIDYLYRGFIASIILFVITTGITHYTAYKLKSKE